VARLLTWSSYFTPPPELDALGLLCLGVGGQIGPVPPVQDRVLDHHGVVFIDSGTGWFRDPSGSRRVPAGSLLQLFPGVRHSYGPDPAGWSEQWVLLGGAGASVHERIGTVSRTDPVVQVADPDAVLRSFARLRAGRAAVGLVDDARRSAQCYGLLLAGRADQSGFDVVIDRLLREPEGPRSIREHAAAAGMSERELRAAVEQRAGITPKQLVLRSRLDRAKALLAETDLPVARVGSRVGYDDPAYFARLFGRAVGMTPTAFRERYLRPGGEAG